MNQVSYRILRIGLGITFIWIADLIWKDPELWSGFLPQWLQTASISSPVVAMQAIAVIDFFIGLFLIFNLFPVIVSAIAAIHLFGLVLTFGLTDLGARDFGLFAAALAIFFHAKSNRKPTTQAVPMQE